MPVPAMSAASTTGASPEAATPSASTPQVWMSADLAAGTSLGVTENVNADDAIAPRRPILG
jgi:hypothetical protein